MLVNTNVYPLNAPLNYDNGELAMSYSLAELIKKMTYGYESDFPIETEFSYPGAQESSNVYGWMDENCVYMKKRSGNACDLSTGLFTMESLTAGAGNLRMMWRTDETTDRYHSETSPNVLLRKKTNFRYDGEGVNNNWYSGTTPIGYSHSFVPIIRLRYDSIILYTMLMLNIMNMSSGGLASIGCALSDLEAGILPGISITETELEELKSTGHVQVSNVVYSLGGIIICPYYGIAGSRIKSTIVPTVETNMGGIAWFGSPTQSFELYNGGIEGGLTYGDGAWLGGQSLDGTPLSTEPPVYTSLSILNRSKDFAFGISDNFSVDMIDGSDYSPYTPFYSDNLIFCKYPNYNATVINTFYTLDECMNMIASFGLYFTFDETLINEPLGQSIINSNIYLGKMYDNGRCDGTYTQGSATKLEPQAQSNMYIVTYLDTDNTMEVEPLDPDTPYIPPEPPASEDNTESGDKIPNQFDRSVGVTNNFITNYLLTEGQISKLGEILWTSWADDRVTMDMVENFYGKLHDETGSWNVSSVLQFITSCRMFPCSLATLVNTTPTATISIGTGKFPLSCGTITEPTFFIANETIAIRPCGSILIPREFNDYRDFENTKITATLPYCGSVELIPQDVVGKWLGCTYALDLVSGACKAFLYTLSSDSDSYDDAYYNVAIKDGQCGFLIPLSATQAGEVESRRKIDGNADSAYLFRALTTIIGSALELGSKGGEGSGFDVAGSAFKTFADVGNMGFSHNALQHQRLGRAGISAPFISGGSGFADFMQPSSPYVQIRRSRYQTPLEYENSVGYPTNAQTFGNVSQFKGFTVFINVDVSSLTCHESEKAEIKNLLENGIYI